MKKSFIYTLVLFYSLLYSSVIVANEAKKPIVVASTTQIADFARQVAGDRLVVKSILAPGADPHTYQPTPDDVQMVIDADLCLENGLHLEGKNWMSTLATDAGKTIFTTTNDIQPLSISSGG